MYEGDDYFDALPHIADADAFRPLSCAVDSVDLSAHSTSDGEDRFANTENEGDSDAEILLANCSFRSHFSTETQREERIMETQPLLGGYSLLESSFSSHSSDNSGGMSAVGNADPGASFDQILMDEDRDMKEELEPRCISEREVDEEIQRMLDIEEGRGLFILENEPSKSSVALESNPLSSCSLLRKPPPSRTAPTQPRIMSKNQKPKPKTSTRNTKSINMNGVLGGPLLEEMILSDKAVLMSHWADPLLTFFGLNKIQKNGNVPIVPSNGGGSSQAKTEKQDAQQAAQQQAATASGKKKKPRKKKKSKSKKTLTEKDAIDDAAHAVDSDQGGVFQQVIIDERDVKPRAKQGEEEPKPLSRSQLKRQKRKLAAANLQQEQLSSSSVPTSASIETTKSALSDEESVTHVNTYDCQEEQLTRDPEGDDRKQKQHLLFLQIQETDNDNNQETSQEHHSRRRKSHSKQQKHSKTHIDDKDHETKDASASPLELKDGDEDLDATSLEVEMTPPVTSTSSSAGTVVSLDSEINDQNGSTAQHEPLVIVVGSIPVYPSPTKDKSVTILCSSPSSTASVHSPSPEHQPSRADEEELGDVLGLDLNKSGPVEPVPFVGYLPSPERPVVIPASATFIKSKRGKTKQSKSAGKEINKKALVSKKGARVESPTRNRPSKSVTPIPSKDAPKLNNTYAQIAKTRTNGDADAELDNETAPRDAKALFRQEQFKEIQAFFRQRWTELDDLVQAHLCRHSIASSRSTGTYPGSLSNGLSMSNIAGGEPEYSIVLDLSSDSDECTSADECEKVQLMRNVRRVDV